MTDIWLKLTSNQAQARAAFIVMGIDKEVLHGDLKGNPNDIELGGFNHDVATIFHENLMVERPIFNEDGVEVVPAVFAGPYLMMRLVSDTVKSKAQEKIIDTPAMPAGLELVSEADLFPNGPTIVWA